MLFLLRVSYVRSLGLAFLLILVVGVTQAALVDQRWWGHGDAFAGRLESKLIRSVLDNADLEDKQRVDLEWQVITSKVTCYSICPSWTLATALMTRRYFLVRGQDNITIRILLTFPFSSTYPYFPFTSPVCALVSILNDPSAPSKP